MNKQKTKNNKSRIKFGLRTRLFLFSSVFLLLIVILFSFLFFKTVIDVGKNTQDISSSFLHKQAEDYLRQITVNIAQKNNEIFTAIMYQALDLSSYMSNVYSKQDIFYPGKYWQADKQMIIGENGQYLNSATATASVFVPNFIEVNDKLNSHLESMAYLDFIAPNTLSNNKIVKAIYMSSEQEATRYYPNIHLGTVVPPDFKITDRDWYHKINAENNPEKKAVLSKIYLDATGNGLMVTAVAPVYVDDKFIGGIGFDITIEDMKKNIEQEKLLGDGFLFFVNKTADSLILSSKNYANITKRKLEKDEWKINKNDVYPGFAGVLEKIALENNGFMTAIINNEEYFVAFSRMKDLGWTIGSIVKVDDILSITKLTQAKIDESVNNYIFYYILPIGFVVFLFVYILIFIFSRHITEPLLKMNKIVRRVANDQWRGEKIIVKTKDEISELANSFNQMAEELLESKREVGKYSQNLEKEVANKTDELNISLSSVKEDKQEMNNQRLATLNILEDVSEAQKDLKKTYKELEQKSQIINTLKNVSNDLTSALDIEEVVRVIIRHIKSNFNFYGLTFLIYDNIESGLMYRKHLFKKVCESCLDDSRNDLEQYLKSNVKLFNEGVLSIINNVRPKQTGEKIDNNIKELPKDFKYYPLISGEKIFGVMQVSNVGNKKLTKDEKSLLLAIVNSFTMSLERLQTIVMAQQSKTVSLVESLRDGVIMFNANEDLVIMNKSFSRYTGFSHEYFNLKDLYHLIPNHKISKMVKESIEKGKISNISDVKLIKKYYEIIILPVRDNKEAIVGGAIIFHDITRLKEIDQMKTEFVSVASHQLRTPLTAIKLFTEMLIKEQVGKLKKEQKEYLENIYESTERMVRLVNDLLNVSRIESGRLRVDPQALKVFEFIETVIAEAKPLADLKEQKINLISKISKDLKVPLDKNLIRQVFHNLIVNAIRYSPKQIGKIEIELKVDKEFFIVSVCDNGIGIPEEAQRRIFEKFYRAENAVINITEGTGLGLYVSQMIVESSNGKIWFESKKDKGAIFFVKLPLKGMKAKKGERGLAIS